MKRSEEFLLQDVAGTLVVVPVGAAATAFRGMITLNSTGAYIWEQLKNEQTVESLTDAVVARYEVTREQAQQDVESFLEKLRDVGAVV